MDEVCVVGSGGSDGVVLTVDLQTGGVLHRSRPGGAVTSLALLRQRPPRLYCSLSGERRVVQLSWAAQTPLWKSHLGDVLAPLAPTPDSRYIFGGGVTDGRLHIWELQTGVLLRSWDGHFKGVAVLKVSPCGHYLFSGGADAVVSAWSVTDLCAEEEPELSAGELSTPLCSWTEHMQAVTDLALSGSGSTLRCYSCGKDGHIVVAELASTAPLFSIFTQTPLLSICVDSACQWIYVGTNTGDILGYTQDPGAAAATEQRLEAMDEPAFAFDKRVLRGHEKGVEGLAFAQVETKLVSAGSDGQLRIWDLKSGLSLHCIRTASASPLTSLLVVQRPATLAGKRGSSSSRSFPPLKKFKAGDRSPGAARKWILAEDVK